MDARVRALRVLLGMVSAVTGLVSLVGASNLRPAGFLAGVVALGTGFLALRTRPASDDETRRQRAARRPGMVTTLLAVGGIVCALPALAFGGLYAVLRLGVLGCAGLVALAVLLGIVVAVRAGRGEASD